MYSKEIFSTVCIISIHVLRNSYVREINFVVNQHSLSPRVDMKIELIMWREGLSRKTLSHFVLEAMCDDWPADRQLSSGTISETGASLEECADLANKRRKMEHRILQTFVK